MSLKVDSLEKARKPISWPLKLAITGSRFPISVAYKKRFKTFSDASTNSFDVNIFIESLMNSRAKISSLPSLATGIPGGQPDETAFAGSQC
jgi:hypothetical protein